MRIGIKTLGCKSNRYESDRLFDALKNKHEVFELNKGAHKFQNSFDIVIVNTCTVTHIADRKSRQAIRSLKSTNPDCKIFVFGCGANISKDYYKKMEEVDFVLHDREEILKNIKKMENDFDSHEDENFNLQNGYRTRALVKIQDGCNNYCSYCIIPFARGPAVSFDSRYILKEVKEKEDAGFKEIVLTGINIGEWEEKNMEIADLFEMLIEKTKNVRFRVSSIEPKNFSGKFFELFETGRFCPHIHMSLQSGSDGVLKRMRRNYDTKLFLEVCKKFRKAVPDIGLTTDVIVGFPGESDEEFEETCKFVREAGFLKVHVFPYSKRKNTATYYMKYHISESVKRRRAKKLREISAKLNENFKNSMLKRNFDVLVENFNKERFFGYTQNYVPVQFFYTGKKNLVNRIINVKLKNIGEKGIVDAEPLESGL